MFKRKQAASSDKAKPVKEGRKSKAVVGTKTKTHTADFLAEIEPILVRLNTELSERLATLKNEVNLFQSAEVERDELDLVDPNTQNEINRTLMVTLDKEVRDTISALERIKKGVYGLCKYCHEPIAEDRLRARPTSSACVECKKVFTDER